MARVKTDEQQRDPATPERFQADHMITEDGEVIASPDPTDPSHVIFEEPPLG